MQLVKDRHVPTWLKDLPEVELDRIRKFVDTRTEHIITYGMASMLLADEVVKDFFAFAELIREALLKTQKGEIT